MNQLSQIFSEVYNAGDPLDSRYYDSGPFSPFTITSSGQPVTPEQAMREATVFSCTRVLSDMLAVMPFQKFHTQKNGDKTQDTKSPLAKSLLYAPNLRMTPFEFKRYMVMCLILRGFFLNKKIYRSGTNEILAFEPCHPDHTRPGISNGALYWETSLVTDVALGINRKFRLDWEDAWYCPYATLDGINPITPIAYNAETIGFGKEMREHGATLFRNNAMPSGVLSTDKVLDSKGQKRMAESWKSAYGEGNRGGVAILEQGLEFKPITMSNADAQYLESRQYTKEEICGILGVATHMISDTKRAKGWSTIDQQNSEFMVISLSPYMTRFKESAKLCLIESKDWQREGFMFNTDELLQADPKARSERQLGYVRDGIMSPDEVRAEEGMNRRPDGEGGVYAMPGNTQSKTEQPDESDEKDMDEEEDKGGDDEQDK